jgi:hypothetical protein
MLFSDHDKQTAARQRTSPVAAARVSPAARAKAATKRTAGGEPVHSLGVSREWGDHAALAGGSFWLACARNRWPNPEPSVPL